MNVLVTCGGGFQGMTLFKELAVIDNVHTFLLDSNLENCSRHFFNYSTISPPIQQKENYESFLYDYCRLNKIDFVIPASVYDLTILSSLKDKFLHGLNCKIVVPDVGPSIRFLNKKETYNFLLENGIRAQKEVNPLLDSSYPIIGKLLSGWGGKEMLVFKKREEFIHHNLKNPESYIWLDYIQDFEEYSIDFSINENGVASSPIIRTRDFVSGGFAVVSQSVTLSNLDLISEIDRLIALLSDKKYFGIYNVQILSSPESYFVSDVNPRIGTSAVLGSKMKNNLIKHALSIGSKSIQSETHNYKYVRYLEEKFFAKIDKSGIKGVVFDLDDTLISNKKFILERAKILFYQFEDVFGDFNLFMITVISFLNEGKAPFLIDEICLTYNANDKKDKILAAYQSAFPNQVCCYPDVGSTLKKLFDKGYKLFILTDNPIKTQQVKMNLFPYADYIERIYYTDSIPSPKPSSLAFNLIKDEYQFINNELVMVGDNNYRDCIGALNSGYRYSFLIHRNNGMVSQFSVGDYYNDSNKIIEIDSLNDLSTYLL